MHKIGPIFDSLGKAWDELASDYDDEQLAFLLEFLIGVSVVYFGRVMPESIATSRVIVCS
jgi:hypothetical protein